MNPAEVFIASCFTIKHAMHSNNDSDQKTNGMTASIPDRQTTVKAVSED